MMHRRIDLPSAVTCGGCHRRQFREWSQSLHHRAWTNANARAATNEFTIEKCRPCHSPMSVFEQGLQSAPDYRDFNQEDGVHCLSCHGLKDGVAARHTREDAPCRPKYSEGLVSADLCFPCHEPTHQAFTEYRTSKAYRDGRRCADCHMPILEDGISRSHGPHGGLNPEFIAGAFDSHMEWTDRSVAVRLRNLTGHKLPGEIPSRSLVIKVDIDGGEALYETLRRPHKEEVREDNRLQPDEERTITFQAPEGTSIRSVQILWKPYPLMADSQAYVLATSSR